MWYFVVAVSAIIFLIVLAFLSLVQIRVTYVNDEPPESLTINGKVFYGLFEFRCELPGDRSHNGLHGFIKEVLGIVPGGEPCPNRPHRNGGNGAYGRCRVENGGEPHPNQAHHESGRKQSLTTVVGTARTALGAFTEGLDYLARKSKIEEFQWDSEVGAGDAAATGILSGLAWAAKGIVVASASHRSNLKVKPGISVVPRFGSSQFKTRFHCILETRLGHIISAGIRSMLVIAVKRGKALWKTSIRYKGS